MPAMGVASTPGTSTNEKDSGAMPGGSETTGVAADGSGSVVVTGAGGSTGAGAGRATGSAGPAGATTVVVGVPVDVTPLA